MTADRGSFGRPILALLCASLLLGGGALLVRGWQRSRLEADVERVARAFLEAVRDGDALSAHALLDDASREKHAKRVATFNWPATPEARVRVRSITFLDDEAVAETRIYHDGFELLPVLHLRRFESEWRITRIRDLAVDPKWDKLLDRARDQRDRNVSRELEWRMGVTRSASNAESREARR